MYVNQYKITKKAMKGVDFMKKRILKKLQSKKGFGINEIIGIAAGVIIAAVVVIPGLRSLAQTMMSELTTWWGDMSLILFS